MKMKRLLLPTLFAISIMANADELKLSNFITSTTFSGDARLRYFFTDNTTETADSDALSTRLRLNTRTKINESFSLGTQLVLGSKTLGTESSNVTFNRIFMDYKDGENTIRAGRMYAPVYVFSDMFMDVNIDGIAYSTKIKDTQLKAGLLILKSEATAKTSDENTVLYTEAVHNLKLGENKLLLSAGVFMEDESKGNTKEGLNILTLGAEYTHNLKGALEMAQLRGQYVKSDANNDNLGYTLGVVIGSKSLNNKGSWQGIAEYKVAEANSFLNVATLDREILKFGVSTCIAPNSNLEMTYEMIEAEKDNTVDKNVLTFTLNHSF